MSRRPAPLNFGSFDDLDVTLGSEGVRNAPAGHGDESIPTPATNDEELPAAPPAAPARRRGRPPGQRSKQDSTDTRRTSAGSPRRGDAADEGAEAEFRRNVLYLDEGTEGFLHEITAWGRSPGGARLNRSAALRALLRAVAASGLRPTPARSEAELAESLTQLLLGRQR